MVVLNLCAIWGIFTLSSPLNSMLNVDIQYRIYQPDGNYVAFTQQTQNAQTFDPTKKYVVLTHGWLASFDVEWYGDITRAFRTHEDTVVIAAGYKEAMSCKLYVGSVLLVKTIGLRVGEMLKEMIRAGVPAENIEMVGHSLGAHIAGYAGVSVQDAFDGLRIRRIFGLDPAGPLILPIKGRRLSRGDAEKVIIIHTSTVGTFGSIGDVDFYPNGGRSQGACGTAHQSDHVVSCYYFSCSINNVCVNEAHKCRNYQSYVKGECATGDVALMGYNVQSDAQGDYYLNVTCV